MFNDVLIIFGRRETVRLYHVWQRIFSTSRTARAPT